MLAAYGEDISSIDAKLQDMDLSDKKENKNRQREQGYQQIDETSSFSQKNNILQAMYDADLISYEEYQEEKSRIAEEGEQGRGENAKRALDNQLFGWYTGIVSQNGIERPKGILIFSRFFKLC